jgi:hypothetical protein
MIGVRFAPTGNHGGIQSVPRGSLKLESTDLLLEENAVASGGVRSYGVTIYYTLEP